MEGIVVFDCADRCHLAMAEMAGCLKDGSKRSKEDGVTRSIAAFSGRAAHAVQCGNFGKPVLQVAAH